MTPTHLQQAIARATEATQNEAARLHQAIAG